MRLEQLEVSLTAGSLSRASTTWTSATNWEQKSTIINYQALWAEFLEEAANVTPSWLGRSAQLGRQLYGRLMFYLELEEAAKAALKRFIVPLHIAYGIASHRAGEAH